MLDIYYICDMSITLLDNTKPKKPKFVYTPPPTFLTLSEKEKHYRTEVERWRTGYNGLTGFQYFYLTQWIFQDNSQGGGFKAIRPTWRQDDEDLIFQPIEKCFQDYWDLFLFKRRECGWSSILSALFVWKGLTEIGTLMGYTSADVDRIMNFMQKKLKYGLERIDLPEDVLPLRWHMPASKNTNQLKLWDENNVKDVSIMSAYETVVNPKAFEGDRYSLVGLDEIAIHGKIDQVMGSVDASRMAGQVRAGLIFAGGTAGTINVESRKILLSKFQNSKELMIYCSFYLGYHGVFEAINEKGEKEVLTKNGYTNHKRAKELIEYQRELKYKTGDMTAYNEYCGAYPLDKDEIFSSIDESKLPEDIKINLQQQNKIILMNERDRETQYGRKNSSLYTQGSFVERGGRVEFVDSVSGRWYVGFHPNAGHRYIAGTDPIPFNSSSKDGSDYVTAIKNIDLNRYEAFYVARLDDPEVVERETTLGQRYYNNCLNMMEMDRGDSMRITMKKNGNLEMLADSPYAIGVKFTNIPDRKGYKAKAFMDVGGGYVLNYLRNHWDKIFFRRIIDEAFRWGTGANLDVLDAVKSTEIYHRNMIEKETKNQKTTNKTITFFAVENGKKVLKTIQVMNT